MKSTFVSVILTVVIVISACMPVSATETAGECLTVAADSSDTAEQAPGVTLTEEAEQAEVEAAEPTGQGGSLEETAMGTENAATGCSEEENGQVVEESASEGRTAEEAAPYEGVTKEAEAEPAPEKGTESAQEEGAEPAPEIEADAEEAEPAPEEGAEPAPEEETDAAVTGGTLTTNAGSVTESAAETEEADPEPIYVTPQWQECIPGEDISSDELFAAYVDEEFGIENEIVSRQKSRTVKAGSRISGANKKIFDYICGQLPSIAAGSRTSTTFTISVSDLGLANTVWMPADLGVSSVISNGAITPSASNAVDRKVGINCNEIVQALIADEPYLLYWFDKTVAISPQPYSISTVKVKGRYGLRVTGSVTLKFPVTKEYAKSTYEVKANTGQKVRAAATNAANIVAKYRGLSDYYIMKGYRDEICALTSYNYSAAASGSSYGNPWQLIWVFDGDPGTNVVCEGYSKAFKYLCDQSDFEADIDCRVVSGNGHMWNIVCMDGTDNYLVDVTNCDTGGIGEDYKLFLVGNSGGSAASGYIFYVNGQFIIYSYDEVTLSTWGTENLTLKSHGFCTHPGNEAYTVDKASSCIAGSMHKVCQYCGDTVTKEIPPSADHTWGTTYVVDKKATATSTGSKSIHCTVCGCIKPGSSVTIPKTGKAANTITAKNFTKTYSDKARTFKLGAKVKYGTPTYKSSSKSVTVSRSGKVKVRAGFIGRAVITIKSPGSKLYTGKSRKITITVNPPKTSLSGVSNYAAGKIRIIWKKKKMVTGYNICYSRYKSFSKYANVILKNKNKTALIITHIPKGRTYYLKMRTFKQIGGKKYYSGWSKVKKVKIKI